MAGGIDLDLLRSLHFVPGNRKDMLQKSRTFPADVIMVDLEDSVPLHEKNIALATAVEISPHLSDRGQKIMVRINPLDTGRSREELSALIGEHIFGISVGKVETPWHIEEYDGLIRVLESHAGVDPGQIKLIPWIESAKGLLKAEDICLASNRVVAIGFGAEDYAKDLGVQRTEDGEEVRFARSMVPIIARSVGVLALDSVYVQFKDQEGLKADAELGLKLGYKGKFSIHPNQVSVINDVFSPNQQDIEYAKRILEVWYQAEAEGRGACSLDGKMVDVPVYERARNLLILADQIASRDQ